LREAGRSRLERLALERRLGASYLLVPAVDNASMPFFYNLATVVVSVPRSDGFPVTVLEASACGAPLIVSSLPYCAEWFDGAGNGIIVPVGDGTALAAAIVRICGDGELRGRLAAAGRRLVEKRADFRRCMDGLDGIYQELLGTAAARPGTSR
jgi:glycosyltransferase involved in cell wall biosynthesis